jgi:xylulokinase
VLSPGRAEGDPRAWLAATLGAGREALGARAVDAVGVAALGSAPILVDAELEPLTPALLFSLDTRAGDEAGRLGVTNDHALPKLLWWQEHEPELVARTAFALDATGFLVARLTGVPVMDAITRADYDVRGILTPVPLPEPLDPLAVAGGLTEAAARGLGLPPGTPVAVGTYDSFADVAGVGVRRPGDACVILGSTLIIGRVVENPVAIEGLAVARYPGEGLLVGGWTASAGSAISWFEREFGAADVSGLEPGAGGLVALPYLAGERTPVWDPGARGLILGLTLSTTREEAYRAIVDAVALSALDHAKRLEAAGLAPGLWLAGGGGTRHEAWLHATCDALGAPLAVAAHAGEAVGPAVLALRAIGAEPKLEPTRRVEPDPRRHERFEQLYDLYCELHPALAPAMRRLAALE